MRIQFQDASKAGIVILRDGKGTISCGYPPDSDEIQRIVSDFLFAGGVIEDADPEPVPRKTIEKDVLMQRITEAGKFNVADSALQSDRQAYWRFLNSNVGNNSVYCDDPQLRGFIEAIGLDPVEILDR